MFSKCLWHRCKHGKAVGHLMALMWTSSKCQPKEIADFDGTHRGCGLNMVLVMLQVIAAPTGSGKTVILELTILRMLCQCVDEHGVFHHRRKFLRAVYLAPNKALVQVHEISCLCMDFHGL
jgi:hypothetical protein